MLIEQLDFWALFAANVAMIIYIVVELIRIRRETKEQKEKINEQKLELERHHKELENQEKQLTLMREKLYKDTYDRCRRDHNELVRMVVEKPLLNQIWDEVPKKKKEWDKFSQDEKIVSNYYSLHLDVFERLFILYENKMLDEKEWILWLQWMRDMSYNWLFEYSFKQIENVLDQNFVKEVKTKVLNQIN